MINDDIDLGGGNNGFKLERVSKPLVGISVQEKVRREAQWEVKILLEASSSLVW